MITVKSEKNQEQLINPYNDEMIAVIDTETNWYDEVMSIGVVVATTNNFSIIDKKYYILAPEYQTGGMYSEVIGIDKNKGNIYKRKQAINAIIEFLKNKNVNKIFAYNALFDFRHLSELDCFYWFDIMKIAANKTYNKKIPSYLECYKNGKLKTGYGVEPMYRILSGQCVYKETHNALSDAEDELFILAMLNIDLSIFEEYAIINNPTIK